MKAFASIVMIMAAPLALSGCTTVKVPDVDFLKLPEFKELVRSNQTNVPDVSEVPNEPVDVRSTEDWDSDARKLLQMRDGFVVPDVVGGKPSQAQTDAEFARLKAQAQAYKIDDPQ